MKQISRRPVPEAPPAPDAIGPLAEQVARLADEQRHAHDETLNRLLASAHATARSAFGQVRLIPGGRVYFLALEE